MKNLILIVGKGKRCGKDTVTNRLQYLLSKAKRKSAQVALASPISEILHDLNILNYRDVQYKSNDYRFFMGYLGQFYNSIDWKEKEDSYLFKEYMSIREDLTKLRDLSTSMDAKDFYQTRYFKCNAIDSYMDHYFKYMLNDEIKGINLWCELAAKKINSLKQDNIIISDCRQLREYEFLLNRYPKARKVVILLYSDSPNVDTSAFVQNEGLFDILFSPEAEITNDYQECKKNLEAIRRYIYYKDYIGGSKNFYMVFNRYNDGNFDTKELDTQLQTIVSSLK